MRHVVLGAGGIGGLLAAVLSRSGEDVTVVVRPSSAREHPSALSVGSAVFGDFVAPVDVRSSVPAGADVLWVAVKSTGLEPALALADPDRVGRAPVVPLLNGIDHVATLRERYQTVCPGTIRVESHRTSPGVIAQPSRFARIAVATPGGGVPDGSAVRSRLSAALEPLRQGGFQTSTSDDEVTLLWEKLAFLAPIALATTAYDAPLGAVRHRPMFRQCQVEAVAAARLDGASVDLDDIRGSVEAASADLRSSMQLDVAAGREPELDAVAGPITRRCPTRPPTATSTLAAAIRHRRRG